MPSWGETQSKDLPISFTTNSSTFRTISENHDRLCRTFAKNKKRQSIYPNCHVPYHKVPRSLPPKKIFHLKTLLIISFICLPALAFHGKYNLTEVPTSRANAFQRCYKNWALDKPCPQHTIQNLKGHWNDGTKL